MRRWGGRFVLGLLLALPLAPAGAQGADGQVVYLEHCRPCHGSEGIPLPGTRVTYRKLRALGDSGFVARLSEVEILMVVTNGIDQDMRSFSEILEPAQILAVSGYIRELALRRRSPSPP